MKAICNTDDFENLTKGKVYEVFDEETEAKVGYTIYDDDDKLFFGRKSWFDVVTTKEKRENMQVVCIKNMFGEFTADKEYEVIEQDKNKTGDAFLYLVESDIGKRYWVPITYFYGTETTDVKQEESMANQEQDLINNPNHYTTGGIETIDFIQAKLSKEAFRGFLLGNIVKYSSRHEHKGGIEDIKKAQWYINKLVEVYESEGK
jgi:hypothetical protein